MRYVGEMQLAQNNFELGFPSINCCNAVIYATNLGLFGFHSFGGDTKAKWDERALLFAQFVQAAAGGAAVTGSRLYSVTFVGRRGYSSRDQWKEELVAYADALNFRGKLRGVNLSDVILTGDSAYVRVRRAGDKCEIFCKAWKDADKRSTGTPNPVLHREIFTQKVLGINQIVLRNIPGQVLTDLDQTGANRAHSARLRGL